MEKKTLVALSVMCIFFLGDFQPSWAIYPPAPNQRHSDGRHEFRYPKLLNRDIDVCINSPKFTSKNRCSTDATKLVADEVCRLYGYARHVDYFQTSFPGHKVVILRETIGLDGTTRVFVPGTGINWFAIIWCKEKNTSVYTRKFTSIRVDNRFVDKCADMERFGSSKRCSFSAQYEAASAYCRTIDLSGGRPYDDAVQWKLAWHLPTSHKIWTSQVTSGNLSQRFRSITGADYFTEIVCRDFY